MMPRMRIKLPVLFVLQLKHFRIQRLSRLTSPFLNDTLAAVTKKTNDNRPVRASNDHTVLIQDSEQVTF